MFEISNQRQMVSDKPGFYITTVVVLISDMSLWSLLLQLQTLVCADVSAQKQGKLCCCMNLYFWFCLQVTLITLCPSLGGKAFLQVKYCCYVWWFKVKIVSGRALQLARRFQPSCNLLMTLKPEVDGWMWWNTRSSASISLTQSTKSFSMSHSGALWADVASLLVKTTKNRTLSVLFILSFLCVDPIKMVHTEVSLSSISLQLLHFCLSPSLSPRESSRRNFWWILCAHSSSISLPDISVHPNSV